jgi:hypothetical protein
VRRVARGQFQLELPDRLALQAPRVRLDQPDRLDLLEPLEPPVRRVHLAHQELYMLAQLELPELQGQPGQLGLPEPRG